MIDNKDIITSCLENPSLIFRYIKTGEMEVVDELLENKIVNINTVDNLGNDVVVRLLKVREYDLVLKYMKKRNWNVNHQNDEGNTFGHILATDNSISAVKIVEQLRKKKNYLPNIKNKKNETALDIALNNHYLYTAFKILEDKRFNDIDVLSFKNLFNVSIKNKLYGKYSMINNLEIIVENLEKKELDTGMQNLIGMIEDNMVAIKRDFMKNHTALLESIINNQLVMA